MKKILFSAALLIALQSCHVPVTRDYEGTSKSLVFTDNKKWLINEIETDLNVQQKENLDNKILQVFNELSRGNATSISAARKNDLLLSGFSSTPSAEDLASLQSTNYDYLVNIRTKKVKDQIAALELSKPTEYSKNAAFAIVEIYDIRSGKKIYHQKASSEVSLDRRKTYPEISAEESYRNQSEGKDRGPYLNFEAGTLAEKNLKKILKDIEKNAIK